MPIPGLQDIIFVSIAGFAVQQTIQVLVDPFVTYQIRKWMGVDPLDPAVRPAKPAFREFSEPEAKKYILSIAAWLFGMIIAGFTDVRILTKFGVKVPYGMLPTVDVLFTGFVIGSGAEGSNSLLKWVQYAKDGAKINATTLQGALGGAAAPDIGVAQAGPDTQTVDGYKLRQLPNVSFQQCSRGSNVLDDPYVYLVFWGNSWEQDAVPNGFTVAQAMTQLELVMTNKYMGRLGQYGVSQPGAIVGSFIADQTQPSNRFPFWMAVGAIQDTINGYQIDVSDNSLFVVILPRGIMLPVSDVAYHSNEYIDANGTAVTVSWPYAVVSHDGDLDTLSHYFSHELVEACTNPDGRGWQQTGTCGSSNWQEIADVCPDDFYGFVNSADGTIAVKVSGYWSNSDGALVAPA